VIHTYFTAGFLARNTVLFGGSRHHHPVAGANPPRRNVMRTLNIAASLLLSVSLVACNRGQKPPPQRVVTVPQMTGTTAPTSSATIVETTPKAAPMAAPAPPPAPPPPPAPVATTTVATTTPPPAPPPPPPKVKEVKEASPEAACMLRQNMRKLWTDYTVWTRDYLIAAVNDAPDEEAASDRLTKNYQEIGAALGTYYGKAGGDRMTSLLKDRRQMLTDFMKAAKAKDIPLYNDADARLATNADQIADALSGANPNLSRSNMGDMMRTHMRFIKEQVSARIDKDWEKDIKAYDDGYEQVLKMSDGLSDATIKQFPDRVGGTNKSQ
jgi:hypothetical protein